MNMKITKYLILAAALLLPSCQKETPGVDKLSMQVAPTLAGETKGSLTTADLTDFYLQIVSDDAAYSYFEHASKDGSGAWTTPSKLFWKNETSPVSYCAARFGAFAFTSDQFKNGVDLEIPADQRTQERLNAADLLTMPAASRKYEDTTGGILPVTLSHGLAKVTFTLTLGPKFYENLYTRGANPVKDFTVKGTGTGFNFQPQTGVVNVKSDPQANVLPLAGTFTPATAEAKSATAVYEAILVPQVLPAGALKVTFRVGAYDYEWSNATAITLAAGKTYDLAVSVTDSPKPEHAFVDMGSGLLWATCNVGATNPWDYGDYFAWGETTKKTTYGWDTYLWGDGTTFTKYNTTLGATLEPDDDAARQNWGGSWRMPTDAEWTWLLRNCTWVWQTDYNSTGVKGRLVISTVNGNQIFLPAAGCWTNTGFISAGAVGLYWSSSQCEFLDGAIGMIFDSGDLLESCGWLRYYGQSVRPVTD